MTARGCRIGPLRQRVGQRGFDLLCAIIGIALLAPVFVAVAVGVLLSDGWPVLYRQQRIGMGGRAFTILKFRTMVRDADRIGAQITVGADRRVTGIGRILRRTKCDELPQLFNVIFGDMALVGPRPEVARYVERYAAAERRLLRLRPGMTDPASLVFRDEATVLAQFADPLAAYVRSFLPAKAAISLDYARRASLASDVRVLLSTVAPRSRG